MPENEKEKILEARAVMRECEAHLVTVLMRSKDKLLRECLSTSDASQLVSVAVEVAEKLQGLYYCRLHKRVQAAEKKAENYRQMLELADRKAAHGCTDAYCRECDGETMEGDGNA